MDNKKHVFFDLDHTLWDYDRSSKETLLEIYQAFDLSTEAVSKTEFLTSFYQINDLFWHQYNTGQIDKEQIRKQRFHALFTSLEISTLRASEASDYFIHHCSQKPYLLPDVLTILNYLEPKYEMHIITNGFYKTQVNKLKSSGISKYFTSMTTSECANSRKPSKEIFRYALNQAHAKTNDSTMIGDNPKTDILGAYNFGMNSILYDPSLNKPSLASFTVQSHFELMKLL